MFITLEADYAVRIVSVLCREKDKMDYLFKQWQ